MKLITDHDVYKITVDFLRQHGHVVVTAREFGLHKASDKELLEKANAMLIFLNKELYSGVIYLKIIPSAINEIHNELLTILEKYTEKELKTSFCVVELGRYRIRRVRK